MTTHPTAHTLTTQRVHLVRQECTSPTQRTQRTPHGHRERAAPGGRRRSGAGLAAMISAILFVNQKGEMIISRFYRDNVSRATADAFRSRVIAAKEVGAPVIHLDGASFMYVRVGDVYICAVTKHNANPALVFQFIYKLVDVFKAYFGGNFDEEKVGNARARTHTRTHTPHTHTHTHTHTHSNERHVTAWLQVSHATEGGRGRGEEREWGSGRETGRRNMEMERER